MPFWCIFAQSALRRKKYYMYTATYDGLLFFRKKEVREEKKNDKVTRAVVRRDKTRPWILRRVLDSGKCVWTLGSVLDPGKCFWILERVLDSGKCFVLMSHGTFTTLLLSNHFPFKRVKLSGRDMCY